MAGDDTKIAAAAVALGILLLLLPNLLQFLVDNVAVGSRAVDYDRTTAADSYLSQHAAAVRGIVGNERGGRVVVVAVAVG